MIREIEFYSMILKICWLDEIIIFLDSKHVLQNIIPYTRMKLPNVNEYLGAINFDTIRRTK